MSTEHPGAERLRPADPEAIGPYRLLGRLGEGGMGTVYLAQAPTGRPVAVKVVKAEYAVEEGFAARFHAEVENARRVASFCTAQVLDNGNDENGRPYMVTEYISGTPLSRQISRYGALEPGPLHGVALGVAAALAAIHVAGLVHRDLKPANVILSMSGPRVIDFGIARSLDRTHAFTVSGELLGSPGWWAPEQVRGLAVTPAADIFAWGCLVAYAGNGRHPFGRGDAITMATRVLNQPPDIGALPAPLHELVRQATAMDPTQRPTAQDLVIALVGGGVPDVAPRADEPETPSTLIATELLAESWQPPANVAPDSTQALTSLGVASAPPVREEQGGREEQGPGGRDVSEITQPGLRTPTGPLPLPTASPTAPAEAEPNDTGRGETGPPPSLGKSVAEVTPTANSRAEPYRSTAVPDATGRLDEAAQPGPTRIDPVLPEQAQPATPPPGTPDVQGLLVEQVFAATPAPAHPAPPVEVPSPPVQPAEQPAPIGQGPLVTDPPATVTPEGRPTGRRWLIAVGAAVAAVAVTAVVLYTTGRDTPVVPPPGGGGGQDQEVATDVGRRIATGDYIADPQIVITRAPRCGLTEYEGVRPANGQFCAVWWTVFNPGGDLVPVVRDGLTLIDDRGARHTPHPGSTDLPPGLTPGAKVDAVLLYDMPTGREAATLTGKVIENGQDIEVRLS